MGFCDLSSSSLFLRTRLGPQPNARIDVSPWMVSMKDDTRGALASILGQHSVRTNSSREDRDMTGGGGAHSRSRNCLDVRR